MKAKINQGLDNESLIRFLKDYTDLSLIKEMFNKSSSLPDKIFSSNQEFWKLLQDGKLYIGQKIKLTRFVLLDWIPISPGLYHTESARNYRQWAIEDYNKNTFARMWGRKLIKGSEIVYQPNQKFGLIKGGLGSLRLTPKKISNEIFQIKGLSSSGESHTGIPCMIDVGMYDNIKADLSFDELPVLEVTCRIMGFPNELAPITPEYHMDIPKAYVEVLDYKIKERIKMWQTKVSINIAYQSTSEDLDYQVSFNTFNPDPEDNNLKHAVEWLNGYSQSFSKLENPKIIGEFDEERNHFPNRVQLPLKHVLSSKGVFEYLKQVETKKPEYLTIAINRITQNQNLILSNQESMNEQLNEIDSKLDEISVSIFELSQDQVASFNSVFENLDKIEDAELEKDWERISTQLGIEEMINKIDSLKISTETRSKIKDELKSTEIGVKHKLKFGIPLVFLKYEGEIDLSNKQILPSTWSGWKKLFIKEDE